MGERVGDSMERAEESINFGVSYREGGINIGGLEVGNCIEIIGESGRLYIFQVVKKVDADAGLQDFNISIQCVHGEGKLKKSGGGIVNENKRIEVGERLYIGDSYTHSSKIVEFTIWRSGKEINTERHNAYDDWVELFYSKGLKVGQYLSAIGKDGTYYVFYVDSISQENKKPNLSLRYMEYQSPEKGKGRRGEVYGDVIGDGIALRVGDINAGVIERVKISNEYPEDEFEDELDQTTNGSFEVSGEIQGTSVGQNPWLSREAVFSQAGVIVTNASEILEIFTDQERRILRILGFSDHIETVTQTVLQAKAKTYLADMDNSIPQMQDPDRAELEILRDVVEKEVESIVEKLKKI